jgi:hypothetical protein
VDSESFQGVATLARFIFAITLFIWALRRFIWPRRKNRKGNRVPYTFRIPSGYVDLQIKGDEVDGGFALDGDKSTITLRSNNKKLNYEKRKAELLTPQRDNYSITYLSGGSKINSFGLSFNWIKAKHLTSNFELTMVSYLLNDERVQIEVGCGARSADFSSFFPDYEALIDTIQLRSS